MPELRADSGSHSFESRYHCAAICDRGHVATRRADQGGVPHYCRTCGAPFLWVSRKGRIYELMNRLEEEQLDPATELAIREQLEALSKPDVDEGDELRRWERVRKLAPEFWEKSGAQTILSTVVSAVLKSKLGVNGS